MSSNRASRHLSVSSDVDNATRHQLETTDGTNTYFDQTEASDVDRHMLPSSAKTGDDVTIVGDVAMQIKQRGAEMRLVIAGGMAAAASVDSTLVQTVARAHVWANAPLSGTTASMAEIAAHHKVNISTVKKIMPLAFLAPDIVAAVMAGKQPAHLTTQMLIRQLDIPQGWQDQRRVLGFTS